MLSFTKEEFRVLRQCIAPFERWLNQNMADPINEHTGLRPRELQVLYDECSDFKNVAARTPGTGDPVAPIFEVPPKFAPLLKRVILTVRREKAAAQEAKRSKTSDPGLLCTLNVPVAELDDLMQKPWFHKTRARKVSRLTDFLALEFVEEMSTNVPQLPPRKYEDKAHIVQAQSIFLDDLRYYRWKCEIRSRPIMVAFVDIDQFKNLNTKYTETVVDRDFLSRFMAELEAHVFSHGFAYRFGGDEYVLLLPNMSVESGLKFLGAFQESLSKVDYGEITESPAVSIGMCHADADCILTDREMLERANWAENYAKRNGGNCVAGYCGFLYREEDFKLWKEPA